MTSHRSIIPEASTTRRPTASTWRQPQTREALARAGADGAEQEAGEPAEATGADDEKVSVGLLDEYACGIPLTDARLQPQLPVVSQLLDRLRGGRSCGFFELVRIESGREAESGPRRVRKLTRGLAFVDESVNIGDW